MPRKSRENGQANVEDGSLRDKPATDEVDYRPCFRSDYFTPKGVGAIRDAYSQTYPYKHVVIEEPIDDGLLRAVRQEIGTKLSFTKKQTDIYTLWQSGDLKNLDGLDQDLRKQLPALHKLRNALYSAPFRAFLSEVTGAGPLSAKKVDMAINVYTPGSHLLAHDDVIGSRRVSYILYLTNPEVQWRSDWGGNLRLFSTNRHRNAAGHYVELPSDDPRNTLHIGWNKMALFAVQPGQSFHNVEEVYAAESDDGDLQRIRAAISGWYHIPQEGEEGYRPGEAEEHEANSGRLSLKMADELDRPQPMPRPYPEYRDPADIDDESDSLAEWPAFPARAGFLGDVESHDLTEQDLDYLLRYINPRWLVPGTVDELKSEFVEQSCLRIDDFLCSRFADEVKCAIEASGQVPGHYTKAENNAVWKLARPSHKQHYLYLTPTAGGNAARSTLGAPSVEDYRDMPLEELIGRLFPSPAFRKWLSFVAGVVLRSHDVRVRRFRSGRDYQLAMPYKEKEPHLELVLGITPSGKWEDSDEEEEGDEMELDGGNGLEDKSSKKSQGKGTSLKGRDSKVDKSNAAIMPDEKGSKKKPLFSHLVEEDKQETNNGGYEVWMAGDEEDDGHSDSSSSSDALGADDASLTHPNGKPKRPSADPAVYQAAADPSDDSGVMFSMPAGWNRLSLVLRDRGTLRFVKYVGRSAGADRWDVAGEWGVDWKRTNAQDEEDEGEESDGTESGEDGEADMRADKRDPAKPKAQSKARAPSLEARPSKKQRRGQ